MKSKVVIILSVLILIPVCISCVKETEMEIEKYTVADFINVKIGMTYDQVLEIMGSTMEVSGYNFKTLEFDLTDGSKMKLCFLPTDELMSMDIIDPGGRYYSLDLDVDSEGKVIFSQ